jgi:hypothetical protein
LNRGERGSDRNHAITPFDTGVHTILSSDSTVIFFITLHT